MKQQTAHLLIATEPLGEGTLVEGHAHGTLDGDDYDILLPELNALLASGQPLSFLLILEDFHGWDLESFWRELKWDGAHREQLQRIAIVGDQSWQKWSTQFSQLFVPGNVRYFDRADEASARKWVRGG